MTSRIQSLRHWGPTVLALASVLTAASVQAQPNHAPALHKGSPDAHIAAALKNISSARIRADITTLVGFGTRSTISAQDPAAIAAGRGVGAAREWIKSQFMQFSTDCGGCLDVRTDGYTQPPAERVPEPTLITDVYAVLKGTDPSASQRIVLVTGHYDSRNTDVLDIQHDAPGANDDASGVAVSLECARVLSKLRFPATIIFLTVAGEEQGLYGSGYFAQMAREQNWNIEAALNNDIVGGDRSGGQKSAVVRVFSESLPKSVDEAQQQRLRASGGEEDSASRQLARYVAETAAVYDTDVEPLLIFRLDRYLRGGDHISFNDQGYAAVRFTEYRENFDHQHQTVRTEKGIEYGDLPKWVDYDYVAGVARVNAATLASLASAPAPPTDVAMLTSNLDNDSTLQWSAVPGAAGYEVLWRDTTSPEWEHAQDTRGATGVTLPISKDNVIFAVRAFDRQGHRSLAVVPQPQR
ncbi:MAG TPA: M20/M25/M40 family metallo-hydrolase [Steroidobacteraceae bacterium]|jgi:Zn-dependent M28 family amino/carboxypeptidase